MARNENDEEERGDSSLADEEVDEPDYYASEEEARAFNVMVDSTSETELDGFVDDESWMPDDDQDDYTYDTLPEMDNVLANEYVI